MPLPEKWDPGQIRFGLGFLYWKKEQWEPCQNALRPFLTDPSLRASASRAEALYMFGRSSMKTGLVTAGQKALERLIEEHPTFKGIEDVYMDLARSHVEFANWPAVERCCTAYVAKHPAGMRRSYMDLCAALVQIGKGQVATGEKALLDLAKSDTFEDVKAEAYFRLGQGKQKATPPDLSGALSLMRKSLDAYPLAPALLEAGRCAVELKNWSAAREFLDRLLREFPKADREQIEQAQQLRRKVMESEAGTRR
jgi:tetratricopeptide (TPR) repeat protein